MLARTSKKIKYLNFVGFTIRGLDQILEEFPHKNTTITSLILFNVELSFKAIK
ncbi:2368_t:CDS:1, partial [Racocetra fulgida]